MGGDFEDSQLDWWKGQIVGDFLAEHKELKAFIDAQASLGKAGGTPATGTWTTGINNLPSMSQALAAETAELLQAKWHEIQSAPPTGPIAYPYIPLEAAKLPTAHVMAVIPPVATHDPIVLVLPPLTAATTAVVDAFLRKMGIPAIVVSGPGMALDVKRLVSTAAMVDMPEADLTPAMLDAL